MLTIAAPLSVKNIYFNARRRYKRHVVSLSEGPIGLKKTHTHMYKSLLLLLARVGICDSLTFATPLPAPPQLTLLFYLSVSLHQSKFPDCSQEPCFRDFFFFLFAPFCCSIASLAPLGSWHTLPRCSGIFPKDLYTEQFCIWQTQCYSSS